MKYTKGDIGVRLSNQHNMSESVGTIYKAQRNSSSNISSFYYGMGASMQSDDVRPATSNEIYWFNQGITNIKNIPLINELNYDIY